jgi:double-strand break repair protein MRE11
LLQISGLLNYYGRTPESDNIQIKPVLLQKGQTKLALYGMSNVRDERLFRTFRDGKVKFFQPGIQKGDWFNLMSVHQNQYVAKSSLIFGVANTSSAAHTETGFLPENFLPEFMDLIVWGHEHECLIDPHYNIEMNFHVMQPGSSVATSLMPGEAVPKHVAILSITGRDFKVETIRLKSVRPFVMREIVLADSKDMLKIAKKEENRSEITRYLISIVDELIEQAKNEWMETQEDEEEEEREVPLPLIRLRVDYTPPEGGNFDCENPQRFSNRFTGKVANVNDVVQFYRKKGGNQRMALNGADLPEESILAQMTIDSVKVEKLVREFLTAQSLTILPQNSFGDAVGQFVDKDDKHAMEMFVNESLSNQIKYLMSVDQYDEDNVQQAMEQCKSKLEELFAAGHLKTTKKVKLKPKPETWDTDLDGDWGDQPGALIHSDLEDRMDEDDDGASVIAAPKGRGKAKAAPAATSKAAPAAKPGRGRKKIVVESEEEEEDKDVVMVDSDPEEEEELFVRPYPPTRGGRKPAASRASTQKAAAPPKAPPKAAVAKRAPARAPPKQTTLNFSQSQTSTQGVGRGKAKAKQEVSDDEISDDDDAFAPPPPTARSTRTRR